MVTIFKKVMLPAAANNSNIERLDDKLSAFRILHTIPRVHSALFIPHFTDIRNSLTG